MIANYKLPSPKTSSFVNLSIISGILSGALLFAFDNPILALMASLTPLCFVVIFKWPEIGLALLIFVAYINLSAIIVNIYEGPSLLKPLIPAMFAFSVGLLIVKREQLPNLGMSVPFLLTYGLVIATTLFVARDSSLTLEGLEAYSKNALIVLIMLLMIRDFSALRIIVWALIASGLFLGFLSVYQQVTQTFDNIYWGFAQAQVEEVIGGVKSIRIGGPILATNQFAMIMLAVVPLGLDRFLSEKKLLLKLLALASATACFLTVTFTFSRSGFLALAVGLLVWVMTRGFNVKLLFTILLFSLLLIPFVPNQYKDRISSLTEIYTALTSGSLAEITDLSFRGRLSEQIAGWRMFTDNPVLGVGYDNYDVYYLEYSEQIGLDGRREERQAHNLYLEILAETGLIGFFVFSLLICSAFINLILTRGILLRRSFYHEAMLVGAIIASFSAYLTGSLFLHASHPRYLWMHIGLALVAPVALEGYGMVKRNPPINTSEVTNVSYSD